MGSAPGAASASVEMAQRLRTEAAMVLHNRAIFLSEAGRPDEAEAAIRELDGL